MCWCNPSKGTRMTDEEIHNIYLHMSGKAEGLVEANGNADFPVLFARAILEYEGMTKDVQNMASKSNYKEQLETKDEPVALVAEVHISRYTIEWTNGPLPEGTKLYTTPQPKQEQSEPVAWMTENKYLITKDENLAKQIKEQGDEPIIPLYTTPQRTWVCLTDAEVFELFGRFTTMTGKSWLDLYRMAETKLKEKNT